ncbi:MAG: T9SS type A sorting domain-containing protein [Crocinitomicaceae bacterium]|nr:T9SS type A sorting domain-containing protein [Crocinitomicaceae bacterium]
MKGILSISALLFFCIVYGQNINFLTTYGNSGYDIAKDIKQDLDTGYICTGGSSSFYPDNGEAYLLKVDSLGNFKWSYNYGGSGSEWGESVVVTNDSAYALCGFTNSFGNGGFDFYLIKTLNDGTPEFEKTYGGTDWDKAFDLIQMPDSGYVLVGETYSYGQGNGDIYMIRTDKLGDTLWTRTYGGTENDYAKAVILDGDSLVVVGGTESFGAGMSDGIILKYHIDGSLGWVQYVGKERNDFFTSIVKNPGNEYFIGGSRHYYYDQTGFLADFWIYNITDDGNTLLADTSLTGGSHEVEIAHDITVDMVDNIFYGGETKSFGYSLNDNKPDAFLGKLLNNYYQSAYVNNFGHAGEDVLYAIDFCYDLGIVGCGKLKYGSSGGMNMFIVRVDKFNSGGGISVLNELDSSIITLSYEEMIHAEELLIYPTVVESNLNFSGFPPNANVMVTSMNGQIVIPNEKLKMVMDLSELAPGLYIVTIIADDQRYSHKIIKN